MDTSSPFARRRRPLRSALTRSGLVLAALFLLVGPAAPPAGGMIDSEVVDLLDADGRAIEVGSDPTVGGAADRANDASIAFAWLDRNGDDGQAVALADAYADELAARSSRYQTVLVFAGNGFAASSLTRSQVDLDEALDAALPGFADGDMARGLDAFTATLANSASTSPTSTPGSSGDTSSGSGGGIGFGTILLVVAVAGGGFLLVRRMMSGRKDRAQAEIDLAEDRAEIEEQLKNNADRVIALGDRVIAKGDPELITLYEEASAAYQDVSQRIDEAENAAEIDELDDRIDHAEWQFEVIEAELDGRPRPQPPTPDDVLTGEPDGGSAQDGNGDAPAGSGRGLPKPPVATPDRSDRPDVATSPRTGRTYPRSGGTRRRGGGLGGVIGGGLGGILADIVLGGGLGGLGGASRRTRRRSTSGGFGGGRSGSLGGGGLGGGVLRRGGGSSRSRSRTRTRSSRSSGGRSIGGGRRSRSRGGRRI